MENEDNGGGWQDFLRDVIQGAGKLIGGGRAQPIRANQEPVVGVAGGGNSLIGLLLVVGLIVLVIDAT